MSLGAPPPEVRFCRSADGTRIAFAVHGAGPPLLLSCCWLSHLEFDWESPVWRNFLLDLGKLATVIRYDERGFGMSDWDVSDFSLEARVADLEAVVDAAGLDRCAMVGMSQGGPVAITYSVRHPNRVSRLVLYGTYGVLVRNAESEELECTFQQLIKVGWARPDSTFRRVFTDLMIPGATEEQAGWLDALQARATSTENAMRSRAARADADVGSLLPDVAVPTLVVHARGDRMNDFADGRCVAHLDRSRNRRAAAGRTGQRQRRCGTSAFAVRSHRRTPLDQHLHQARLDRTVGARCGRRPVAQQLTCVLAAIAAAKCAPKLAAGTDSSCRLLS
jgi:pimeloyl-ACP methyl ester carboxylesterase